jgi:integrase
LDNQGVSKLPRKITYLTPKNGRFYFRIRIPDDLRETFGKNKYSEPIGDLNKAQAEVKAAQLGAHWQSRFLGERHRLGLAPSPPAPAPENIRQTREGSLEELRAVAALAARAVLHNDEEMRIEGMLWTDARADLGIGVPLDEAVREAISGRSLAGLKEPSADWLRSQGLELPANEDMQRRALYAWAQGMAKATAGSRQRDHGESIETPPEPALPPSLISASGADMKPAEKPAHRLMLRGVLELWSRKSKRPSLKTIETATRVVGQFEEVCGNPPLEKLTRQHGLQFRDWLLSQGQSPRTAADRLDYVSRLIRFEMKEQQRVMVNLWARVTLRTEGSNDAVTVRKYIKPDRMAALFSIPLFQDYALPEVKTAGQDAACWISLLGAFTGARVTELAQLLVSDIHREDGLWCISIINDLEWQSMKNTASKRNIPMHPELVRLGLPEYAEALRKAKHERLFPMAPVSALNNAGGPFATWFSKLKIGIGWTSENTFHSFRHTIETILKRNKMYTFDINAYTGHKQPGGDAYTTYTHPEPADLLYLTNAIQHEKVSLPRVFPPSNWVPPPLQEDLLMTKPRGA